MTNDYFMIFPHFSQTAVQSLQIANQSWNFQPLQQPLITFETVCFVSEKKTQTIILLLLSSSFTDSCPDFSRKSKTTQIITVVGIGFYLQTRNKAPNVTKLSSICLTRPDFCVRLEKHCVIGNSLEKYLASRKKLGQKIENECDWKRICFHFGKVD